MATISPGIGTVLFTKISFCRHSRVLHIYCDTVSLLPLACGDVSHESRTSFSVALFVLLTPLSLIIFSYVCVIATVMKMASRQVCARVAVCLCAQLRVGVCVYVCVQARNLTSNFVLSRAG